MLTLSMIVKDEEKYLKDCLTSVDGIADEIVIVDTGSNDKTIEIAKEFGAKVYSFDWIDDFAAARNFALEKSNGDWLLYLDADERLSPESKDELIKLTSSQNNTAYYCKVNSINEITNRPAIMDYVRLFPQDNALKFEGKIHEQIEKSLKKLGYSINKSNIEIIHVGYNVSDDDLREKANRNLGLLLNEYENNSTSYYAYQIGQTYGKLNDKVNAEKYFQLALQDSNLNSAYRSIAYRYLAINYAERGDFAKASQYINESIAADSTQPIALLAAAKISLQTGKAEDAKYFCKRALIMNDEYLSGKRSSQQSILLDNQTILNEGILLAATLADKELFNFFYDEFQKNIPNISSNQSMLKAELFYNLFADMNLNENIIEDYINALNNEDEVNVVTGLLDNYSNGKAKLILLKRLFEKFPYNTTVLNKLAIILEEFDDFETAEKLLEESYSLNNEDPAVTFYLISVYLKNEKFDKIQKIIAEAEATFEYEQVILDKIEVLKSKLTQFIN